jgi:ABC-type multidrug transport system ATPase subunit
MNELLFSVRDGVKRYRGRVVLRVANLAISKWDRILVLGSNGSGKSTLLRVTAGLSRLDTGQLETSASWSSLKIGYLPQEGGIYRDLTIAENISSIRRLVGGRRVTRQSEIADKLGISRVDQGKPTGDLSGGMRRIAGLCCFLCCGVDVLILDEPSSSLDADRQIRLYEVLATEAPHYHLILAAEHVGTGGPARRAAFWSQMIQLEAVSHVGVPHK